MDTVEIPADLIEDRSIPRGASRVYVALQRRWRRDGEVYVPHDTLAAEVGISTRSLRRYLAALIRGGYVNQRPAGGPGGAKIYFFSTRP